MTLRTPDDRRDEWSGVGVASYCEHEWSMDACRRRASERRNIDEVYTALMASDNARRQRKAAEADAKRKMQQQAALDREHRTLLAARLLMHVVAFARMPFVSDHASAESRETQMPARQRFRRTYVHSDVRPAVMTSELRCRTCTAHGTRRARRVETSSDVYTCPLSYDMLALGSYCPGMMTSKMNADKTRWMVAVAAEFGGQYPLKVDCNSKLQSVRFEFAQAVHLDQASATKLLNAWVTYYCTGVMYGKNGIGQGRKFVPGQGVINVRPSAYGSGDQTQWFTNCFVNFPDPPPADNILVVPPIRVVTPKKTRISVATSTAERTQKPSDKNVRTQDNASLRAQPPAKRRNV